MRQFHVKWRFKQFSPLSLSTHKSHKSVTLFVAAGGVKMVSAEALYAAPPVIWIKNFS